MLAADASASSRCIAPGHADRRLGRWAPPRARLIVYACGIAVLVDLLTGLLKPVVLWTGNPVVWTLAHIAMHLPTLLVLRQTRSIVYAGNYYIAVIFLQSALQLTVSNGFSAFGFIAIPLAGAHLVGLRSAGFWTAASIGAALALPALLKSDSRVVGICVASATLTLAIGVASIIVESTRASAVREKEAAEGGMRLHRDRLRAFVEQTFPCLAETENGRLAFVSESVKQLLGYTPAEILATGTALVRPEDVALIIARMRGYPSARSRAEIRVKHRNGHWLWLEVFATPFGETPKDARWLFAARDIDDEIKHRERIEQAQRLEGIGALAAGIAHDFNNLLTVIAGFGSQLPESEAREQVLDATTSAAELTGQLLAFGRSGPRVDAVIDPVQELVALTPVIRSLLGEEVGFASSGGADGSTARIAVGRFKQVILNLVTNAKEAMPSGGKLEIAVRRVLLDRGPADALGLSAGPFVEIAVRDTGAGMSEEVRRHASIPSSRPRALSGALGSGSRALTESHAAVRERSLWRAPKAPEPRRDFFCPMPRKRFLRSRVPRPRLRLRFRRTAFGSSRTTFGSRSSCSRRSRTPAIAPTSPKTRRQRSQCWSGALRLAC